MTNCYVVHPAAQRPDRPCWIVDAGFDPEPMIRYIQQHKLTPSQVVLTHAHVDHIAGLETIRQHWPDLPIVIHEAEREFPADPALNLSIALTEPVVAPPPTGLLQHGQKLELDGLAFEVRHTPGHSPGGVSLYQPDAAVVLVGDALFAGGIGRFDFPTSDEETLLQGIRTQLYTLPDTTRVLSGHGPPTTIGHERAHNPYVRA